MVLTSPFSSIKGYIVSKPPLVLFTVCLIGFAVTTFTFAYYVEHKEELPNIDAHRDLVSFLKYLSKKKLCVVPNNAPLLSGNMSEDQEFKISVKAKLNSDILYPHLSSIHGFIPTNDWMSECQTSSIERVKISLTIPEVSNHTTKLSEEVCVLISGPEVLLRPAFGDKSCSFSQPLTHNISGHIVTRTPEESLTLCSDGKLSMGQLMSLDFQPSDHNSVPLSLHDRSVINLHLFHTSYFLLVMAVTLICYAMIKGRPTKHQPLTLDKMPLETYEH